LTLSRKASLEKPFQNTAPGSLNTKIVKIIEKNFSAKHFFTTKTTDVKDFFHNGSSWTEITQLEKKEKENERELHDLN